MVLAASLTGLVVPAVVAAESLLETFSALLELVMEAFATLFEAISELFCSLFG